jgi:hypothetical protein
LGSSETCLHVCRVVKAKNTNKITAAQIRFMTGLLYRTNGHQLYTQVTLTGDTACGTHFRGRWVEPCGQQPLEFQWSNYECN